MQQGRLALSQAPLPRHLAIPDTYYCPPPAVGARAYRQENRQGAVSSQALLVRPVTVSKLVQPLTRLQACSKASVFMREVRESWHPTLLMMGFDVEKELPEDALLGISGDIPGLVPTVERSFDFIQKEVHTQLAHLLARERDIILRVLAGFEPTVLEMREIPRMASRHQYDMDIPQRPGPRPVASRPYSVAPHPKAELWRQIESLLKAGIIRESHSFCSSPVLFAPKKDGKLRLCIDYRCLNQ